MTKKVLKRIDKTTKQFEKIAKQKKEPVISKVDPNLLVPSGSTMLNLECSGRIEGAFLPGEVVNLIGDSHSGKSLLALTMLAECMIDPRFSNYRLIYDDVEAANEFDLDLLFGTQFKNIVEFDIQSHLFEDFDDNVTEALDEDLPFIYVLDSFDSLTTKQSLEKAEENKRAREKGNKETGSYGDGKAKLASNFFARIIQKLKKKKSLLFIISQTRDNIGFGAMFAPKVRSGGKALKFYCSHEIWLACQKKEKKKKRTIVTNVQAKITKNKLTGHHGEAFFPILFDYGIDNITSCIDFLRDENYWKGGKKSIDTKGFVKDKISMADLVRKIENESLEEKLFSICQEVYDNIIQSIRPNRKKKYGG